MRQTIIVANLIDWSEAFTDKNGSFYCGTTDDQKRNAARVTEIADLVINETDLHPIDAPEFAVKGGLYPVHNAVDTESVGPDLAYAKTPEGELLKLGDKTVSPRLTKIIDASIGKRRRGIIVPRGVYFQGGHDAPFCDPSDIEETFDASTISPDEFIDGDISYVIAPKQYFDATRLDSDVTIPQGRYPGIPDVNYNVFSLLEKRFPSDNYDLVFVNTGVVEGICRLHTSIGLKQMFPRSRIVNIADATTPLYGIGLGYDTPQESRDACMKVCKDIGIEYMSTEQFLDEFGGK